MGAMPRSAQQVLDQEFLQVRAKILEIASFFDRLSEAEASEISQAHLDLLEQGCAILDDEKPEKARRIQLLFSREYDPDWRQKYEI